MLNIKQHLKILLKNERIYIQNRKIKCVRTSHCPNQVHRCCHGNYCTGVKCVHASNDQSLSELGTTCVALAFVLAFVDGPIHVKWPKFGCCPCLILFNFYVIATGKSEMNIRVSRSNSWGARKNDQISKFVFLLFMIQET